MAGINYFQTLLSDINHLGEAGVIEVLRKLNDSADILKAPFFGKLIDLVYKTKGNDHLLVKFDFIDKSKDSEDWLADEEKFNDEEPLYFSSDDHRVSPVYEMECAKRFFANLYPEANIYMLLVCNYNFTNYCDMTDIWEEKGVYVVQRIKNVHQPEFGMSLDAPIPEEPQTKTVEEESDEEFDRRLNEFITEGLKEYDEMKKTETEAKKKEEEEKKLDGVAETAEELEDDTPGKFIVCEIKLLHGPLEAETIHMQPPLLALDLRRTKTVCLSFEALYMKGKVKDKKMEINLYNELGQLINHDRQTADFIPCYDEQKVDFIHTFPAEVKWTKGSYVVEIKYCGTLVTLFTFAIGLRDVRGQYKPDGLTPSEVHARPFDALDRMVGLKQVKEQMQNYRNMARLSLQRKKNGLQANTPSLHAAFMGGSGTGKTSVARLYGAMLHELGLLSKGHVVFRERSSLVGPGMFNEESNTRDAINEAKGGVLFIDEAYTLYKPEESRDPGRNVIETLLTAMSDEGGDWALLLAGYPNGISGLLSMNQGFSSRIPECNRYHFRDYTVDELMQIADSYCQSNHYILAADARDALQIKINHDYQLRDEKFGNARYVVTLFKSEILMSMAQRVAKIKLPQPFDLLTIKKEDIPALHLKDYQETLKKLHGMVGLTELKKSIESHLNMVKLTMLRNEQGIESVLPPLHMVFTGNPGTGKTTVASFIGEIYASLGLLSKGDVIYVERKDLVGQYIGDAEKNTAEVLNRAKGNVLFIDEAYNLALPDMKKDFGHRALEVLLSTLSKERIDMLVIMAGYPKEMEEMLNSNPGLKSRLPYTFHFVDYTADELMQIAESVVKKSNFSFTSAAHRELRKLVDYKLANKDANWGNARFITRLISSQIIPAMSNRLMQLPSSKLKNKKLLSQICQEDIPSTAGEAIMKTRVGFDETAVRRCLKKLDTLVGLEDVKRSIHNFVQVARYMEAQGGSYLDNEPLRWNFTGNTGTGKSTVAKIMAELLKAMHLLEKGHLVEVKAEEMFNVSEFKADEVLQKAMTRSSQGLLFIDGDAPQFKDADHRFNGDILRFKLSSMTMELPGMYALIIAENERTTNVLTRNLRESGVSSFDHTLHFADYNEEELLSILKACLKRKHLKLSAVAAAHMQQYIHALSVHRKLGYANARTMSKLAHAIADNYLLRKSSEAPNADAGKARIVQISDVERFVWKHITPPSVGFIKPS